MNTARRYDYNLPWPAVIACAAFYAGLSAYMVYLAREYVGIIFAFLITLSVILGVLGVIVITRRLVFPRIIELTDDAILYPRGFPKTRITTVPYADILRIENRGEGQDAGLTVITGRGKFAISESYFTHTRSYLAVREFICTKTPIALPREDIREQLQLGDWRAWGFPEPILRWNEPEDWPRYRTHLVKSKPLLSRLIRAIWFFTRCFAIISIPWLLLRLLDVPTAEPVAFMCLDGFVSLFITWIFHWLATVWPVHCTEISFRDNGITQFFGKQEFDWNYHQFSSWAIIERQYERRPLFILLLQGTYGITSFAIADIAICDQLAQLLHDKGVPHIPDLRPPWEDGV